MSYSKQSYSSLGNKYILTKLFANLMNFNCELAV